MGKTISSSDMELSIRSSNKLDLGTPKEMAVLTEARIKKI